MKRIISMQTVKYKIIYNLSDWYRIRADNNKTLAEGNEIRETEGVVNT